MLDDVCLSACPPACMYVRDMSASVYMQRLFDLGQGNKNKIKTIANR